MAVAKNRKEKQRIKIHIRRCMNKLGPDVAQPVVGIYYTCMYTLRTPIPYVFSGRFRRPLPCGDCDPGTVCKKV